MCKICNNNVPIGVQVNFIDSVSGYCECKFPYILYNESAKYEGVVEAIGNTVHVFTLDNLFTCVNCKQSSRNMTLPCTKHGIDMSEQLTISLPKTTMHTDAFLECVSEAKIVGHPVKLDSDLNEDEWHVQSEIKE